MTAEIIPLDRKPVDPYVKTFRFTQPSLKKATAAFADRQSVTLRDTECRGLVLRKQRRDWQVAIERKIHGKVRRVTIETYDPNGINLASVRHQAATIMGELAAGTFESPTQKAERRGRAGELEQMTVSEVVALHGQVNPQLRANTLLSYGFAARVLTGGTERLMIDVDTPFVRAAYDRLCADKSAATANLMLRSVKALWNTWFDEFPDGQQPAIRNPVKKITSKRGRMVKVAPRSGSLGPSERLRWYQATRAKAKALGHTGGAYRALSLLFLTGCRLNEICGLTWAEIGDDDITIDGDRMKGHVDLTRPITAAMREVIEEQRQYSGQGDWVFPARTGDGHLADLRKAIGNVGTALRPHDLRRTYIGSATMAGVPDVGIKMLVGHTVADITQEYAQAIRSELPQIAATIEEGLLTAPE